MKHKKKQPFTKTKKAVSITLAALLGALGIGGTVAIVNYIKDDAVVSNQDEADLTLTGYFNIDDPAQVKARAEAILKMTDVKLDVEEVMNIIYYMNGKYDSLILNGTDKEKVMDIKIIAGDAYELFNSCLEDDVDCLSSIDSGTIRPIKMDDEIFAFHFMPGKIKGNYRFQRGHAKSEAIELGIIVNKQLKLIENAEVSIPSEKDLTANAEEFYKFVVETKNDDKLTENERVGILLNAKAVSAIFTRYLSAEKVELLNQDYFNIDLNAILFDICKDLGLEDAYNEIIKEAQEKGEFGKPITELKEEYKKDESKEAATHPAIKDEKPEKVVVDNGGKPAGNSSDKQEVIKPSEPTTKVEEETWTEPVTEGEIEVIVPGEDGKEDESFVVVVPNGGGQFEVVVPGGDVVSEEILTEHETNSSYESKEEYVDDEAQKADEFAQSFVK